MEASLDISLHHPSGDQLERKFFSNSLAQQIWEMSGIAEGYVLGIEAEWGAGKSSVVNFSLHRLLHLELESLSRRTIFHGDVAEHYSLDILDELSLEFDAITKFSEYDFGLPYVHPDHFNKAIAKQSAGNDVREKQIYRYFRLRSFSKSNPKNLIVHFRPWLIPDTAALSTVFIEELTKSVGSILGAEVEEALRGYSNLISGIAPAAGLAAQAVLPGAGTIVRDLFSSLSKKTEKTLEQQKSRLEQALRRMINQKIVVVIDDLDRLSPKEAVEMIGLVKSLGNLPNVVYVVSYDPAVLAGHITRVLGVTGEHYLEKIIQYRRRLPLLPSDRLMSLLDGTLTKIFDGASDEILTRLQDALFHVGKRYIQTPRDAIRCADWAMTAHNRLKAQTDPVDLLIMEIINAKDPLLYSWIRKEIDLLCQARQSEDSDLETLMRAEQIDPSENRKKALAQLFPYAASVFARPTNRSTNAVTARRIYRREYASYYFELSEPFSTFSKDVFERLFESADPAQILHELVDKTFVSNYGQSLRIDLLDGIWEKFSQKAITLPWVLALNGESVRLIRQRDLSGTEFLARENITRLSGIITSGLELLPTDDQGEFMRVLFEHSSDLSLAASVFRRLSTKADVFIKLQKQLSDRLTQAAIADEIFTAAAPREIVLTWQDLGEAGDIRSHFEKAVKERTHFVALSSTLLHEVNASDEGRYFELQENAATYADIYELEQWASETQENVGEKGIWANRYLDACRRQRDAESRVSTSTRA